MNLNPLRLGGIALLLLACGSAPPRELIDARAALDNASYGPAPEFDPAGLYVAARALQDAETTYELDGNCEKTRDRAYVAMRKVERAETLARTREYEAQATESARQVWNEQVRRYLRAMAAQDRRP